MIKIVGILLVTAFNSLYAAELQHSFNSPAFSGVGYSSHVLTIDQLEDRKSTRLNSSH